MPVYCYSLLADTVIPTGIIMMHAYNSVLNVDKFNDMMFDGSNNLHVVKAFMRVC